MSFVLMLRWVKVRCFKFNVRKVIPPDDLSDNHYGFGRELFSVFRQSVNHADQGVSVIIA
ncbi:hypothetical protein [Bartonella quintana]|uniref:hypothetical protein n=1 Tax=Bartonella quintana TaxID=803 RepID=UPI0002E4BC6D|nr:hypothetical protein [Bartonella quintana]